MTKGSSGLLIMNEKEARRAEPNPCIRCGKCVSACPMGLEPYLLSTLSAQSRWEDAEKNEVTSCIECGSCAYTCPASVPLVLGFRVAKQAIRNASAPVKK